MIDIETIKQHYATMLDSQLVNTLKQDGITLLPEAYAALKTEFQKRHLDLSYFDEIEEQKRAIHEAAMQKIRESVAEEREQLLLNYILSEKERLSPDDSILFGLNERGLNDEEAAAFLADLKEKLSKKIDHVNTQVYVGGAICVLGIFVTLATYAAASQYGGYTIIAWGAIIFGAVRAIKAMQAQKELKAMLNEMNKASEEQAK